MLHRLLAVALLIASVTGCAHRQALAGTEVERLALRQDEFFAALAARDTDAMAALFADSAVLHIANMPPVDGRSAIHRFYGNVFRFLSASRSAPQTLYVSAAGDMAYGTGTVANEFRGADGVVEYTGKYVLVWRKLAGDWTVVHYGVSSNQPEAGR